MRKIVELYKREKKSGKGGKEMMSVRTDLALERIDSSIEEEGITHSTRGKNFRITETIIKEDKYGEKYGKKKGTYITLEGEKFSGYQENFEEMAEELAEELKKLIPEGEILVAGLGNDDITPDALGVKTAERVIATKHLEESGDKFLEDLRNTSVICAGVMGMTGIESAEHIKAVCERIKPCGVIAVDALACSDMERLGSTVQISTSGISPGSGVQNRRKELSESTLGIPVIAIGVPTVIDLCSLTGSDSNIENMMVTPRDIDRLTERSAKLVSIAINLALQPSMTYKDIEEYYL